MSTIQTHASNTGASRAGAREWIALAVLMLPVLLVAIDNTVLSFALPTTSSTPRDSSGDVGSSIGSP